MTATTASPLVAHGLTRSFRGVPVLNGVDLELAPGSVTGLIGRNGAGKTTLIRCLMGLLRRDGGRAEIHGLDPWSMDDRAKERLGYVAQEPDLPGWVKVQACLEWVGATYPTWDVTMVADLVRRWELPTATRVNALSGGQRQVLAIIAALGHRPPLLVLDEPASALDPLARRRFLSELLEVVGRGGTVLFSTHLTADLERVADRVAIMRGGRIAFHGGLDELVERTKRLRVDRAPAQPPAISGLLSWSPGPQGAAAVVHGDVAAAVDHLRSLGCTVAIDDLNLDDIIVDLHR